MGTALEMYIVCILYIVERKAIIMNNPNLFCSGSGSGWVVQYMYLHPSPGHIYQGKKHDIIYSGCKSLGKGSVSEFLYILHNPTRTPTRTRTRTKKVRVVHYYCLPISTILYIYIPIQSCTPSEKSYK